MLVALRSCGLTVTRNAVIGVRRHLNTAPILLASNSKLDELLPKVVDFPARHIGPRKHDAKFMLNMIGYKSLDEMTNEAVPKDIKLNRDLALEEVYSEADVIKRFKEIVAKNQVWRSYIGMGYYNTCIPHTILRNMFENPGWTTQYTPYQPEIAQGRLESLLNYQTMVSDLTGLPIANASLLDEGTSAAEALGLCFRQNKRKRFALSDKLHPQTISCVETRAIPFGIEIIVGNVFEMDFSKKDIAGVLFQYPDTEGSIKDFTKVIAEAQKHGICPVLRAHVCSRCGATGDDAHTNNYCPHRSRSEKMQKSLLKELNSTKRNASGIRRRRNR